MSPSPTLPTWLADAIDGLATGDADKFTRIYAPDAIHEFPFATEGRPGRLEGMAAIEAYMREIIKHIRFGSISNIRAREIGDETIVEAEGHHHRADGAPFNITYVWFITRRDGLVTHFRDYMNPLQLSGR